MGTRAGEGLKTLNARIKSEKERLAEIFEKVDENRRKSAEKLIDRAAFMLISLENMEERIKRDGLIVKMKQGEQEIDRAHPLLEKHITMTKNYAAVCKQLEGQLPEPTTVAAEAAREMSRFAATKGKKS